MTASPPRTYATYPSPDGEWRIEIVIHDCVRIEDETEAKAYEELRLIHTHDGVERVIQDQLRYCAGLGAFGLDGLRWSADSRYFFFTDAVGRAAGWRVTGRGAMAAADLSFRCRAAARGAL